jgi:Fe-S-cluster containining protein
LKTFWLSTHVRYRCKHAGACCTARWPVPIERDRAALVRQAIDAGGVTPLATPWLVAAPDAPTDVAGLLASQPSGACVFHAPPPGAGATGRCRIHAMRPIACEHFPYVTVVDPRGVHVTLSHYCPTAAALLFADQGPMRIVAGPPVHDDGRLPEGLDARDALPPIRAEHDSAGRTAPRLMAWAEVTRWERQMVRRLSADTRVPAAPHLDDFDRARAAVVPSVSWPEAPPDTASVWRDRVAPRWAEWAQAIGRFLAARAHASWAMCLGNGPADVARLVRIAGVVLQVESVRQCVGAGRNLDRSLLTEAIRRSDLLLVHYCAPERLIRSSDA